MRKSLRFPVLFFGSILAATSIQAQDHFVYAMTDVAQQNGNWVYLRILNTETGVFSGSLINGTASNQIAYDAATKKPLVDLGANKMGIDQQPAFNSGVAAIAYDNNHGRVYYTPMFIDQLRYYDLKSQQVYYVTAPLTNRPVKTSDQGANITRMVIGADGYGYAMTNDATQLLRFSTGKKPEIVDLGSLVDDPANKGISIHNSCSSYGGDMVADNDGNLYVISARNQVFKVNIETKVATHLGSITGLPANFTANGAAVTTDNKILISSAVDVSSFFVVDPKNWNASVYKINGDIFHTSDLGNSNILITKQTEKEPEIITRVIPTDPNNNKIQIYPNPVTTNQFNIQFSQIEAGKYNIQVTDMTGQSVLQRNISIGVNDQTELIKLSPASAKGIYLIKIVDQTNKAIFSKKIVVQ